MTNDGIFTLPGPYTVARCARWIILQLKALSQIMLILTSENNFFATARFGVSGTLF